MTHRTPPVLPALSALQAFEAAARLGSFTRAAAERHLTHSSISRAVQNVEHWSGQTLFDRAGPLVRLTPAGQALCERIADPLAALHAALGSEAQSGPLRAPQPLDVYALPSLVATWLLPRLSTLLTQQPHLRLSFHTGTLVHSLAPLQAAVALRFGRFEQKGLRCWPLWDDQTVAVATPQWVALHGDVPDLWPARERLQLHTEPWPLRLKNQSHRLGLKLAPAQGLAFNDASLLAQAALMHLGVAWVRRSVVSQALSSGELVELAHAKERQGGQTMWLVCRDELAETPPVKTFVDWALRQAKELP